MYELSIDIFGAVSNNFITIFIFHAGTKIKYNMSCPNPLPSLRAHVINQVLLFCPKISSSALYIESAGLLVALCRFCS